MSDHGRRAVLAAGAATLSALAGCSFSVGSEGTGEKLDVVSAYRDGEDRVATGRDEYRTGSGALDRGENDAAGEAFARAETAFGDAVGHFEKAVTLLEAVEGDDGRATCVEAVETAGLYESSAASLVEAVAAADAGDTERASTLVDEARTDLTAAQKQRIADAAALETELGLDDGGPQGP